MVKKRVLLAFALFFILPMVSASLKIEKEPITDTIISELNNAAVYKFVFTNLGDDDSFRIYSLVGAEFDLTEPIYLKKGEVQSRIVNITVNKKILETPGVFNFIYKLAGEKSGIQEDTLAIKIMPLEKALEINSYNLHLDTDRAVIYVKNYGSYNFREIKANFKSAFFDFDKVFSLDKYEKKEFEIQINSDEMKKMVAGDYILTANLEIYDIKKKLENKFKFTEKANIVSKESVTGIITRKHVFEKINEGNIPFVVQINVKKNALTRLFTTFNIEPTSIERKGFFVYYTFQKEIKPSESLNVRATTSFLYILILLLALIVIGYLTFYISASDLVLKKKTSLVRTKGGEFALKITLLVKANEFVEKIKIIDKIPSITKLHERFVIQPDLIDEKNKRIEWNISELQKGEERVFSYIIYSKVAPFGKFELPSANAFFERNGKVHETISNKVFFITGERERED